jgi:hypothetical protein
MDEDCSKQQQQQSCFEVILEGSGSSGRVVE